MADDDKELGAPYVAWSTFKKALDDLAQGLPNQIDRSVWKGQSWGTQSQLLTAFKFLGLTEERGKPTVFLTTYASPDLAAEASKQILDNLVREKYADLFALDLTKATPEQVDRAIAGYRVTGETREKAVRFFLSALLYLGIPVSPLLQPKPPNGTARKRGRAKKQKAASEPLPATAPPPDRQPGPSVAKVFRLRTPGGELTISTKPDFLALVAADRKLIFDL